MRSRMTSCRVAAWLSVVVIVPPLALAHAQAVSVSAAPVRPANLAGLYRVETPSIDSTSVITFLRLYTDGRNRLESVHIDASGATVGARVEVGQFHRHPWRTKALAPGASPQLCFEINRAESCAAFHMEGPHGDLLLFAPEALWGKPTWVLRRQAGGGPPLLRR
jgi:hypothetical protein